VYSDSSKVSNVPSEKDVCNLAKILCMDSLSSVMRTLPCLGAFKDGRNPRYGFVYRPPAYIENLPSEKPDNGPGRSEQRKPTTLLDVLKSHRLGDDPMLGLDLRFEIARGLVQSIFILHLGGWVHKK
jgi:hypothetical protein